MGGINLLRFSFIFKLKKKKKKRYGAAKIAVKKNTQIMQKWKRNKRFSTCFQYPPQFML